LRLETKAGYVNATINGYACAAQRDGNIWTIKQR